MNELEKLYNVLIERGLYTKSFQEFQQRYSQDEEYKNKVYDVVSSKGLYTKGKNSFFQKYSGVAQSLEDLKVDYQEPKKKAATASYAMDGSSVSARIPKFEAAKPEIAASESTRVPNVRIPQKEQAPDKIDEKLQILQEEEIDRKSQDQSASKELETNPIISFGKKFWETLSLQTPAALQAKGAQGISNLAESDMRLLKSISDVPDDEIIEMPSLTDPRAGRKTKYKAGEYKRLISEKIAKGNKATAAALDLAIKLNKDLENSDVISSLTQVKDGYDLLNFISSSVGQTLAQVPASVATGGSLSYAMESGNIYLETVKEIAEKEGITPLQVIQQGKDQVALAEIGGAISGALEFFGAKKVLDMFGLENIKKDLRKKALTILINSQVEGATEVGQEFVSTATRGLGVQGQLKTPTLTQALDAYAAGVFGAAGVQLPSLLGGSKKETESKKEEEKTEFTPGETITLDTKTKTPKVEPTEEILQPVILDYGDSKFGFIRDESGNMEMTKELDTEEQAISMAEMLGKTYKKLDFTIQEVDSTDPYTPTKYKIVAREKAPGQTEVSYTIDGSKMDRNRFVAAVQEATTEDALNELETTDPEVQKVINAKRAEITGKTGVEDKQITKENIQEKIAENNSKYEEIQRRQKSELEELNKRENKNYADAFDILNVNEYSQDQTPRSQDAIDLANRHEKEFNDLLQEKRNIESEAEKLNFSDYNLTDTNKLDRLRESIISVYQSNRNALDEGFEASVNALDEANSVGASDYVAHGMGKTSLANAYNDLINLFNKGINPIRGRGALDVAPLSGGVSTGTTASGNAYMDGPFTLVANRNHSGPITNINQVGGIIVNEGIATDEVLNSLRDLFPNLVIESTSNTKKLVEQLNSKKEKVAPDKKTVTINVADKYTADEVERVKALPIENEDGATMNLDGTKYEKGGVVIPLSSRNLPLSELTQEKINEFVKENSESIGSDLVKVGIYKFPGRDEASIDINIVADRSRREEAIQIARELGQESVFDLDTFENIKTGADGRNPKVLSPKEFLAIQERLSRKPEVTVTPETSSNYANMTEDNEGNFVFFHVGDKGYETIKPGTGKAPVTSREEASALGKVGGMAMYYTGPEQGERQSAQGAKYAVKVAKNKVYDFNTDPLNLIDEAKKRHEAENPGKAFDPNSQIAYVTKIAGEKGFDMVVAEWAGGTRAQTTKELTPVDVEESTGNVVEKKFSEQFKSNKEKGFKAFVPARKADKLQKVYEKINEERNSQKRYDDLYRLYTETNKYTQQEITDLINNSDLSQELKDEYNTALDSKEEARRSERTTEVETAKQKKESLPENIEEAIKNSAKTLQTSFPGVEVIVADNINEAKKQIVEKLTPIGGKEAAESVAEQMKTARGQAVFYNGKPVAVIINKEKALSNTAAHEVWHLILREAFGRDAKKFKSFQNAIARELKNSGYADVAEYLDNFAAAYEGDAAYEEYLAELGGLLTTKGFDPKNLTAQEKSILNKIKDIINKFAKSMIGKDVFLKDAKPENILQFMIDVSDLLAKGEDVRDAIGKGEARKGKGGVESSLQANFSDKESKLTFIYDKNSEKFDKLKREGFINDDVSINDFNGKTMLLHQPDAAFSGEIQKNGETIVEGKGGIFFPAKFHEDLLFWAGTKNTISQFVNSLNKVSKSNGGKIYMALTSAPYHKLLSSTTMSNALVDFFSSKTVDKNFKISEAQLKSSLVDAAKYKATKKITNKKTGKVSYKEIGLKINLSKNDRIESIKSKIAEKLGPDNSNFDDRKLFAKQLIKLMAGQINKNEVSITSFGKLFSQGIQNKYFKGITKTGKIKISAANMEQALSEMFTEPMLKEGFNDRSLGGEVYAIIEVDGEVDSVESDKHESYPVAVKAKNPVKIHILKDRVNWYDVFNKDGETGGIKESERTTVYPTTGVSTKGLQLNIPGVEVSKQLTTDKDVKPGFEAALNAINETVEDRSIWRKQNKVNQKQKRTPIVEQAAKDYYNGLITQEDYLDIVKKNQPIKTFKSVPELPSVREIVNSLDENKVATGIIGVTKNIKDGDKVASRLDIPAYEDFDTWVVSIHDGDKEGKSIAYGQTAVLKNVNFKTFPGPAIKIAMGTQSKSTIARIFGNWVNENPESVQERAKKLIEDPEWTQVGMNPFRHSYFYDKTDGMPVATADEVIQVGALVLAKNAKKVLPSDPMFTTKSAQGFEIQFQKQLPARVNEQINNIISEQKALGNKPVDVAREAAKYLKGTDAYKNLGDRDKSKVLSGVKRLSGMRVKVTVDEYAALKDQIKLEAKSAKNYETALKNLVASVRSLVKAGKISSFRAGVIIGRIAKTNLASPEAVNKTINYVADIFDNANLAMKVSRAKSLVKNAKRNIKSKIGQNPDLFNAGKVLISIDPHFIPTPMIDDYLEIMEVIGERARVLSIKDSGDLTAKMNVIINAVMNESESSVISGEESKVSMTPEETRKSADDLIKQIGADNMEVSNIVDPDDAAIARRIASITEGDMIELLSEKKDGSVDFSKLKLLLGIRDNIKAGIVTHEAMVLATTVAQNRNKKQLLSIVNKTTGAKILNGVTRTISKIKGAVTGRSGVLEAIRSTPLEFIDDVVGNFNDKTIHRLTFGILGSPKGKLDARLADLAAKADAAEKLLQSFGRTDNAVVEAKYKIMALQLQREFESNPGSPSVAPAIEFIDATLRAITRKESSLTNNDARILQKIRKDFGVKDANGNQTIDTDAIENSLTVNDKKAMALIDEINSAQASEALFTSAVIRGNRVNIINNYVHHAVLSRNQQQEVESIINRLFDRGANGKPSTKAGTLNERTPGAKAIMFDPVSASMRGARETLTDYYMTPAIREVTGTLNKLKDTVFDDPNSTQDQKDIAQALVEAVQESLEITFQNHFSSDTNLEALFKAIQKLGYQTTLASIPRAFAELSSNMSFAILSDPKTTTDALKYTKFAFSTDLLGFLEKIGSAESTRLAGNQVLTGKYAEGGFAAGYGRTSKSAASSKLMDYASFITRMTIGKVYRTADVTSDLLISTPDKVVSKAYYVADFINNFEKETGIRLTNDDLKKISEGTSEYLSPEFETAIQKARQNADSDIVRMAASGNSFNTILKNAPRKTDKSAMSAYRAINSFMSRFYLTEYGTLRSAVIALFKSGEIDKKAAAAIIAASVTRMSMYVVAYSLLSSIFDSILAEGLDLEEEEEDKEDLLNKVKRSIVGTGIGVLSRRTLGNLGYMPVAFGVEQLNAELGEDFGLRDDEYDPFKNSLVYSKISESDLQTKSPYEVLGKAFAGPMAPLVSSVARATTLYGRATKEGSEKNTKDRAMEELETRMVLEAAGNLGLIPFYKDARRILLNDFYARNYDKKEDSSFTITEKQIDLVRKSNPAAARRLKSFKEQQKKIEARQRAIKKKFENKQTKSN